jgi:translocation and assembly module TamA
MRFNVPGFLPALLVTALGAVTAAHAADPQSYRVDLATTGEAALDATIRSTSELESLRDSAPVSPFGLIARARGDAERLKTVLESYGYYQSTVTITIEGLGLNHSGLAEALAALPNGQKARVALGFTLGPLYHLRKIEVDGDLPSTVAGVLGLQEGQPAVAADVLAAGGRLQAALEEQGYAFAKVDPPIAYEDQTQPVLDVSFHANAGARVNIGEIRLEGLERVHEVWVRRRLIIRSGQQFGPAAIEAARRDLLSLGVFASVTVRLGQAVDGSGGVPVTFVLRERKRHAVSVNAAFSSDLGGSGGATWTDRDVFGGAEQLSVTANVINLGGSDTNGVGYDTSAKFVIPDFGHRDQSLQIAVGAIRQYLEAYDQKAVTSGVTLSRKLSSIWSATAGVATSVETVEQNGASLNYTLVALPLSINYDSTHLAAPLDDPTHGMRNSLNVTPTQSLGRPSATFIISQVKLASYFDLHELGLTDPGRSVLAVRALAGQVQGAGSYTSLPPDQRFYAGGSGTTRGYAYQLVGPLFPGTQIPEGGTTIAAGSLEFRERVGSNWGYAVFVDGGEVGTDPQRLPTQFKFGAGVGLRYYTPIGPVRMDFAVPLSQVPGVDQGAFQVYIGLGQAF